MTLKKEKKNRSVGRDMTVKLEVEERFEESIPYRRCKVWIERKEQGLNDKELPWEVKIDAHNVRQVKSSGSISL